MSFDTIASSVIIWLVTDMQRARLRARGLQLRRVKVGRFRVVRAHARFAVNACPTLTNPAHGSYNVTTAVHGEQVRLDCDVGYNTTDARVVDCINGTWPTT